MTKMTNTICLKRSPTVRKFLKAAESERGTETIEFAIVAVVLFTCIFAIIDCSRALYTYHFSSYTAREAARYAMVRGSTWGSASCATTATFACNATAANVTAYVQSIVPPGINSGAPLSVTTTWPGTALPGSAATCSTANGNNSPGCQVMVQVSYSFNYFLPFLPTTTLTMRSTSEVVILQ
jgi:Flp pilus assembly protein TadG